MRLRVPTARESLQSNTLDLMGAVLHTLRTCGEGVSWRQPAKEQLVQARGKSAERCT